MALERACESTQFGRFSSGMPLSHRSGTLLHPHKPAWGVQLVLHDRQILANSALSVDAVALIVRRFPNT
jgi:hypothetical protein